MNVAARDLASRIDHTLLRPDATLKEIRRLCQEAAEHQFASVCVMPYFVVDARNILDELESTIPVCTVIGFPNGSHLSEIKLLEAQYALDDGALELDVTMNLGAFKSGRRDDVADEIRKVAEAAHDRDAIVKVILETSSLNEDEIRRACAIAAECGADFVKTSTGFGSGGATVDVVRLMREASPETIRVKASGGISDYETARALIDAGAERIGTSKSVAILAAV